MLTIQRMPFQTGGKRRKIYFMTLKKISVLKKNTVLWGQKEKRKEEGGGKSLSKKVSRDSCQGSHVPTMRTTRTIRTRVQTRFQPAPWLERRQDYLDLKRLQAERGWHSWREAAAEASGGEFLLQNSCKGRGGQAWKAWTDLNTLPPRGIRTRRRCGCGCGCVC